MFEMMLIKGKSQEVAYPDSGPGTKTLKYGTTALGYFGEVSQNEMFTLTELRRQTDFWVGTDISSPITWVKMFVNEKVIFFPWYTIATGITWNSLYAKGLVYGVDGNGTVPGTPAVNQLTYMSKGSTAFKVRLFNSTLTDPFSQGGSSPIATTVAMQAGEWGKTIMALLSPRPSGYTGINWNIYAPGGYLIPNPSFALSQSTRLGTPTECLTINNIYVGIGSKAAAFSWIPVLEYTPGQIVYLPIKDPLVLPIEDLAPLFITDADYTDSLIVYRLFSGGAQMGRAIDVSDVVYDESIYRINTNTIKMQHQEGTAIVVDSITYE